MHTARSQLTPQEREVAAVVLEAVKASNALVFQMRQDTVKVSESADNGIVKKSWLPMWQHYKEVAAYDAGLRARDEAAAAAAVAAAAAAAGGHRGKSNGGKASGSRQQRRALYMHNKSLIEVVGEELTHKLYGALPYLATDVLVNYPALYQSDNPKASNDVLVGGRHSWSPVHQDLPLYCTSVILVLEGHKEFVLLHEDSVKALRVNTAGGDWEQPVRHEGKVHANLKAFVEATGGVVVTLRAGDFLIMPPRVYHLARNCDLTVSCNFSVCQMEQVPLALSLTFASIKCDSRDPSFMLFDKDFARLLEDCTKALLKKASQVKCANPHNATRYNRLPPVRALVDSATSLMGWYAFLQCIPKKWVEGFWGELRNRLLEELLAALPLHTRTPAAAAAAAAAAGAARGAAAEAMGAAEAAAKAESAAEGAPAAAVGGAAPLADAAHALVGGNVAGRRAAARAVRTARALKRSLAVAAAGAAGQLRQPQQRKALALGSPAGRAGSALAPRVVVRKQR
ncbi:hypothetical protein GPECTOR_114g314 [Gonium pectorale]|uniref:Cupin-like domain-containing protein n=1 Tax=Gonium pectorale TaxID=33097 RepID=A0A150FZ24_GONPE|nr:hypothetical protein GPECTOR_114g314 [Gonium pectorale]|eukprot:KXZ42863.1 hypothetical protein GPECTOR_114g314 [Gonium pectorale]